MLFALIMPEILVGKALQDFLRARRFSREMRKFADGASWTITHSFYADMGGFVYHIIDLEQQMEANTLATTTISPQAVKSYSISADKAERSNVITGAFQLSQIKSQNEKGPVLECRNAEELVLMRGSSGGI
jgi:hypothetical protein